MNNIIMGRILPFLITVAAFSSGCVFASQVQVQTSSSQSQSSSDSDRGGRSLFRDADERRIKSLLEQGNKFFSQGYWKESGEKYAVAALLGSKEALEKLVAVANILKEVFIKEAREFYEVAASLGHEEAKKELAFLANDTTTSPAIPLENQEAEPVLIFGPDVYQTYMSDIRRFAQEKQKELHEKTERKE